MSLPVWQYVSWCVSVSLDACWDWEGITSEDKDTLYLKSFKIVVQFLFWFNLYSYPVINGEYSSLQSVLLVLMNGHSCGWFRKHPTFAFGVKMEGAIFSIFDFWSTSRCTQSLLLAVLRRPYWIPGFEPGLAASKALDLLYYHWSLVRLFFHELSPTELVLGLYDTL